MYTQAMWRECGDDNAALDDIVLEAQRLWPPFLGGRRVCTQVSHDSLYTCIVSWDRVSKSLLV